MIGTNAVPKGLVRDLSGQAGRRPRVYPSKKLGKQLKALCRTFTVDYQAPIRSMKNQLLPISDKLLLRKR